MKIRSFTFLCFVLLIGSSLSAQNTTYSENHGHTLNLGLGVGGYGDTMDITEIHCRFLVSTMSLMWQRISH